jgi:hypothetical protein
MATWKRFAESNPELADIGAGLLFQYGVGLAFLATIRKDGGPRLHPVCPVLSDDRLYVLIMPDSPKRWDLLRDGRYALQSFPPPREESEEFYIRGRAELVEDPEVFASVFADAKHQASENEILFELMIDRAMYTSWENWGTPDIRPVHTKWLAEKV